MLNVNVVSRPGITAAAPISNAYAGFRGPRRPGTVVKVAGGLSLPLLTPPREERGGESPYQLMCGPGPSAASSTAARHSRLIGRIGGIGAVSGSDVAGAIDSMFSVCDALRMKAL